MARKLSEIGGDILNYWSSLNHHHPAYPYVKAMLEIPSDDPHYKYLAEEAEDIVLYFLANAGSWRGTIARQIKQELKQNYNIK